MIIAQIQCWLGCRARLREAEKLNETAWGIIANASHGDWTLEKQEWQDAAARWRDRWFEFIKKE